MQALKPEQSRRFYKFGPFLVDRVKCSLLRDGEVVPLSLKAFELLLALIEHRGRVLEKDWLLNQVWPDLVVEENNLARNISALRKALEEQPNEHHYILTVPGKGYRFIASIREIEDGSDEFNTLAAERLKSHAPGGVNSANDLEAASTEANAKVKVLESISHRVTADNHRLRIALAALFVSLGVISFVAFLTGRKSPVDNPRSLHKLWQLTFDSGLEVEPTWSPDGRLLAYSSDRDGNFDVWVRPAGEGNAVRVTSSPAHDRQPDWAPDNNRLAFRSERDGGGLFVVPVLGGNEQKVSTFGYQPSWSPDGTQILFYSLNLEYNVVETPKVYLVGTDGQPPREVLRDFLPEFIWPRVSWHPDGKSLSLWGQHRSLGWSFWNIPLGGGTPARSEIDPAVLEQLRESEVILHDFVWSPSGRSLYFEGISRSVRNLWKVDIDPESFRWTGGPERLTTGANQESDVAISASGKKLAFTVRNESTRLWSIPFDFATGRIRGNGGPVTEAGIIPLMPDLSPDGQKVVFVTNRAGKRELREVSLKDYREKILVADDSFRGMPRWSPDGTNISYPLFRRTNAGPSHFEGGLVLRAASGGQERMFTTPASQAIASWDWSTDKKWILGGSDRQKPGRMSIWLMPIAAAPHAETQMQMVAAHPEENLYQGRFSPNQKWVSFIAAKANEAGFTSIYVVPVTGGEWIRVTDGRYFDDKPRWSPDGRRLYFISNRTGFFNVWGIGFDPEKGRAIGEPFRVTTFESPAHMILPDVGIMEMALAADRIILPIMEVSGGIWILENVER